MGPSLSEQRGYGGKSEAESPPASPNSRRTPSAGPSQVSSVQQPAQITKSFNNRNTANTYTYRVAPRHGRAQNYPRDYVQSYSSSNAAVRFSRSFQICVLLLLTLIECNPPLELVSCADTKSVPIMHDTRVHCAGCTKRQLGSVQRGTTRPHAQRNTSEQLHC